MATTIKAHRLQPGDQVIERGDGAVLVVASVCPDVTPSRVFVIFERYGAGPATSTRPRRAADVWVVGDWTCESCGRPFTGEHWSATDCNEGGPLLMCEPCCNRDHENGGPSRRRACRAASANMRRRMRREVRS